MAISWNVDELRSTVKAQMEEANRLDVVIEEMSLRAYAAEAEVVRLRAALTEALDPNTEWTVRTWLRLLAVRDGETQ